MAVELLVPQVETERSMTDRYANTDMMFDLSEGGENESKTKNHKRS
jgi:hypothetical protein